MNWKRKSIVVPLALCVYTIVIACMYIPRQTPAERHTSYITLGASFVLILVLSLVLRKKEKIAQQNKDRYDKKA